MEKTELKQLKLALPRTGNTEPENDQIQVLIRSRAGLM